MSRCLCASASGSAAAVQTGRCRANTLELAGLVPPADRHQANVSRVHPRFRLDLKLPTMVSQMNGWIMADLFHSAGVCTQTQQCSIAQSFEALKPL